MATRGSPQNPFLSEQAQPSRGSYPPHLQTVCQRRLRFRGPLLRHFQQPPIMELTQVQSEACKIIRGPGTSNAIQCPYNPCTGGHLATSRASTEIPKCTPQGIKELWPMAENR